MSRVLIVMLVAACGLLLALLATAARPGAAAGVGMSLPGDTAEAAPRHVLAAAPPMNEPPVNEPPEVVSPALPACTFEDRPAPLSGYDQWQQTVLDTVFALDEQYAPADLVAAADAFPAGSRGGGDFQVRAIMIDDLTALLADAWATGVEFAIQSAYRSYTYQLTTFQYWVDLNGLESALASSARPGHSEHQLGTAIDFRSANGPPAWDLADWAQTPEGGWLAANAWRYGFVMSYPAGSKDLTCYDYEPWHYRYLGRDLAAEVERLGVTPRELLWAKATGAATTLTGPTAQVRE